MIRRIIMAIMLLMISLLAMPLSTQAFDPFQINCGVSGYSKSAVCSTPAQDPSGPGGVLLNIAHIAGFVAGALAIILIVYGSIKYITSNGDASKIQNAKNTIVYSLVGVAVIVLAEAIINFVIARV